MIAPSVLRTGAELTEKTRMTLVGADDLDLFVADGLASGQRARQRPFLREIRLPAAARAVSEGWKGTAATVRSGRRQAGAEQARRPCDWRTAIGRWPDRR